jgi:hypothetical protein
MNTYNVNRPVARQMYDTNYTNIIATYNTFSPHGRYYNGSGVTSHGLGQRSPQTAQ